MVSEIWENKLLKSSHKLKLAKISDYITVVYEANWCLGYILQKNEELDEVKITFFCLTVGPLYSSHIQETLVFDGS